LGAKFETKKYKSFVTNIYNIAIVMLKILGAKFVITILIKNYKKKNVQKHYLKRKNWKSIL
jgi:hypothetical protein